MGHDSFIAFCGFPRMFFLEINFKATIAGYFYLRSSIQILKKNGFDSAPTIR